MPGFFQSAWTSAKKNPWTAAQIALPVATAAASAYMTHREEMQHALQEAAAKADAYKQMLKLHPHLPGGPETARLYESIYTVSPTFAKDPLVAGAMMDRIRAESPYGSTSHQGLLGVIRDFGGAEKNIPAPPAVQHTWGGEGGRLSRLGDLASSTLTSITEGGYEARREALEAKHERDNEALKRKQERLETKSDNLRSANAELRSDKKRLADAIAKAKEVQEKSIRARNIAQVFVEQAKGTTGLNQAAMRAYRKAQQTKRDIEGTGANLQAASQAITAKAKELAAAEAAVKAREERAWRASNQARRDKIERDGAWARGKTSALAVAAARTKVAAARDNSLSGMLRTLRV